MILSTQEIRLRRSDILLHFHFSNAGDSKLSNFENDTMLCTF